MDNEPSNSRRRFLQLAAATAGASLLPSQQSLAHVNFQKAHFVFVHGAWYGAWCWHKVLANLEHLGQQVSVFDLPAHGVDSTVPGTVMLNDYTNKVLSILDSATEPVILVGHSLGGVVISTVAEVRPQAIGKLVYLSAFLLQDGQSAGAIAAQDTDSLIGPILRPDPANGTLGLDTTGVEPVFFGHTDDENIALAHSLYKPDPIAPFGTPIHITQERFGSVRRFYISCLDDKAISLSSQRRMLEALPCEAVLRINTDHSPFLSTPDFLTVQLLNIAHR
jgi:pimeloyl-ACP methyl ester carboxylesterase